MRSPVRSVAGASVAVLLPLAACGSPGDGAAGGRIDVVASTNVWGDVVSALGGDRVSVTSLITSPSADPHSFEATPRTQLAVTRADVVVENGGGYDDFMHTLRSHAKTKAAVVDAVDVSGKKAAAGGELNEHVWYDLPTVKAVADRVAAALTKAEPGSADTFRTNNQAFQGELDALIGQEAADRAVVAGAGVAVTEPVPLYMTEAVGAVNRTPAAFSAAIEEGDDVSPAVLRQTLDLFSGGQVKALVHNEQTTGPETAQVLAAARAHGIAVVPVTEILPAGEHYVSWMRVNLDAIERALTS